MQTGIWIVNLSVWAFHSCSLDLEMGLSYMINMVLGWMGLWIHCVI